MPTELRLPMGAFYGFLLATARIGGALSFVPIPGIRNAPAKARVVLAVSLALALSPVWPSVEGQVPGTGLLAVWLLAELAFGATVGVAVAFLQEAFVLASQIFGLQAGYGYASTIDPSTEADSSVLQIVAHLMAGLFFFAFGMDRQLIRIFAQSFAAYPPGSHLLTLASAAQVLELGGVMFATAVRLSLPVVGLLILVDLSLALLGRINAQLQLLTLAFPAKMLASMALLAAIAVLFPLLYRSSAEPTLKVLQALLVPR